jgi:hypothetical protein
VPRGSFTRSSEDAPRGNAEINLADQPVSMTGQSSEKKITLKKLRSEGEVVY